MRPGVQLGMNACRINQQWKPPPSLMQVFCLCKPQQASSKGHAEPSGKAMPTGRGKGSLVGAALALDSWQPGWVP